MAKKPAAQTGRATGNSKSAKAAKSSAAKSKAAQPTATKTSAAAKARAAKARAAKAAQARLKAKAEAAQAQAKAQAQAQAASPSEDEDYVDPTAAMNAMGGMAGAAFGENDNYLDMLTNVFDQMSAGSGWDTQQFDSMTRGMELVLGSGPAFAALGTMMANTTAQGAVLMNAAQTQRQLDQVGLCCTSACVKQLLSMNNTNGGDD